MLIETWGMKDSWSFTSATDQVCIGQEMHALCEMHTKLKLTKLIPMTPSTHVKSISSLGCRGVNW